LCGAGRRSLGTRLNGRPEQVAQMQQGGDVGAVEGVVGDDGRLNVMSISTRCLMRTGTRAKRRGWSGPDDDWLYCIQEAPFGCELMDRRGRAAFIAKWSDDMYGHV
jgi:hypothetical protein